MTKQHNNQQGFSVLVGLLAIIIIAGIGLGGWYVATRSDDTKKSNTSQDDSSDNGNAEQETPDSEDETADWTSVTTQNNGFSMRLPDGWKVVNYPDDFLGSIDVAHQDGTPAVVENVSSEYAGHSLLFRASIVPLDDAGLGPQWASPQPGLDESTKDFSIGDLQGKRYKGVFTQDLNQTLYEYVFELGDNKKLDIVYTVDHSKNQKDDITIVEQAISTIDLE